MKKKEITTESVETYRCPFGYQLQDMVSKEPSCWNGRVAVRRYRITAEVIDEPNEVIAERIRKLWRECDNHHHWLPLKAAASKVGIELSTDECGIDRDRK